MRYFWLIYNVAWSIGIPLVGFVAGSALGLKRGMEQCWIAELDEIAQVHSALRFTYSFPYYALGMAVAMLQFVWVMGIVVTFGTVWATWDTFLLALAQCRCLLRHSMRLFKHARA